eukprot:gene15628-16980_t
MARFTAVYAAQMHRRTEADVRRQTRGGAMAHVRAAACCAPSAADDGADARGGLDWRRRPAALDDRITAAYAVVSAAGFDGYAIPFPVVVRDPPPAA